MEQTIQGDDEENSQIVAEMFASEIQQKRAVRYPNASQLLQDLGNIKVIFK